MAEQLPNRFTQWALTPLEQKIAYQFNDLQTKVIQNHIAEAAHLKLALTYDPTNPTLFAQQEAEYQGQIEILEYLLAQAQFQLNSNTQFDGESQ